MEDLLRILAASTEGGRLDVARFARRGVAACNPLLAFQLMNNFTLCHGAILEGVGGPSGAMFSRGAGTTAALIEALHAVRDGECERAIAGGADSAIHPVTRAELTRDGFVARGLVPSEGAALVALAAGPGPTCVAGAALASGHGRALAVAVTEAVDAVLRESEPAYVDLIVLAPWGPPAADALRSYATRWPGVPVLDVSTGLGDALAASPALAWVAALDLLAAGRARRALVIGAGTDGDVGASLFTTGAP
jgi:hypothetical protein